MGDGPHLVIMLYSINLLELLHSLFVVSISRQLNVYLLAR